MSELTDVYLDNLVARWHDGDFEGNLFEFMRQEIGDEWTLAVHRKWASTGNAPTFTTTTAQRIDPGMVK